MQHLDDFFKEYNNVALAFSGGVDSAYLLYAAKNFGANITAYYVKTQFQPEFEYEDAMKLIEQIDVPVRVLELDVLQYQDIKCNPNNRCYFCKKVLFNAIIAAAKEDGYSIVIDGTNASDDVTDRPGMKALEELKVLSPLRICNLTKDRIRELSKQAGLFTWNKPAYACLATRVKQGEVITAEVLKIIERAEAYLNSIGFSDVRVRESNGIAKIQIPKNQFGLFFTKHEEVRDEFTKWFDGVLFDLVGR